MQQYNSRRSVNSSNVLTYREFLLIKSYKFLRDSGFWEIWPPEFHFVESFNSFTTSNSREKFKLSRVAFPRDRAYFQKLFSQIFFTIFCENNECCDLKNRSRFSTIEQKFNLFKKCIYVKATFSYHYNGLCKPSVLPLYKKCTSSTTLNAYMFCLNCSRI